MAVNRATRVEVQTRAQQLIAVATGIATGLTSRLTVAEAEHYAFLLSKASYDLLQPGGALYDTVVDSTKP
jgi:hypothetical protein